MVSMENRDVHRLFTFLLISDPAVKQILITMDAQQRFILEDLDDNHLVIKADEEFRVRRQLETEVRTKRYTHPWSNLIYVYLHLAGKEHV